MVYHGHLKNGVVVLDDTLPAIPDGTPVTVEIREISTPPVVSSPQRRQGGQLRGKIHVAPDFDELPPDIAEALGMNAP